MKKGVPALNMPLQRTVEARVVERVVLCLYPLELPSTSSKATMEGDPEGSGPTPPKVLCQWT